MNWSLFVSEYPVPILTDELPLLTLATVESEGFASGKCLEVALRVDRAPLDQAIRSLEANKLVENVRGQITASERGKLLLDRLGLSEPITFDFLGKLVPPGPDFDALMVLVTEYRNWAYRHYLTTVKSCAVWSSVVDRRVRTKIEGCDIGGIAIVLRGLRSWLLHRTHDIGSPPLIQKPYCSLLLRQSEQKALARNALIIGPAEGQKPSKLLQVAGRWARAFDRIFDLPPDMQTPENLFLRTFLELEDLSSLWYDYLKTICGWHLPSQDLDRLAQSISAFLGEGFVLNESDIRPSNLPNVDVALGGFGSLLKDRVPFVVERPKGWQDLGPTKKN